MLQSTTWTLGGQIAATLSVVGSNSILLRVIGPSEAGAYFVVLSVVAGGAAIGRLGLETGIVRSIASAVAHERLDRARGDALAVPLVALLGAIAAAALLLSPLGTLVVQDALGIPEFRSLRWIIAAWLVAESSRLVLSEGLRGFGDVPRATILGDAARNALFLAAVAAMAISRVQSTLVEVVSVAAAASTVAATAAGAALYRTSRRSPTYTTDLKPIVRMIGPLVIVSASGVALAHVDIWIAGAFEPAVDVALYGASNRIALLMAMPLFAAIAAVSPSVARLASLRDSHRLQDLVRSACAVALVPTLTAFVVVLVFGGEILQLVFGDFYRAGSTVLILLAAGQVVNVSTGLCGVTLIMAGHERSVMKVAGVTAVAMAVVCSTAAHLGSIEAVAASSGAVMMLQNGLLLFVARRHVGIWTGTHYRIADLRRMPTILGKAPR